VKATGKAWVVRTTVASGATLGQNDVMEAEVDWAEETNPVVQGVENWLGQTANRPLSTGQTLRQGMLRPSQVFQPGALVRVVAEGAGFQASADAQALSAGVVGQPARVRMDNGRITSGVVLDSHTVKVEL
jgi:flagella basal body P-ring formation protein FlgA